MKINRGECMNIFKKAYCRVYQTIFHLALPLLPYREPIVYDNVDKVVDILRQRKLNSALLVTDSVLREMGVTKSLETILQANDIKCVVYDKTRANRTVDNGEEALSLYLDQGCECLIAFGGGSSMDCAKAVGARVAYPKKSLNKLKGILKVRKKIPTLIAIPTTAGTGSEVTLTAVITDPKTKHKYTMNDFPLIPSYAILDPKVTYTLPPSLTATTGLDALTHCVEAYIGRSTTKETRQKALEATSLIFKYIERAFENGEDNEARANMLKAAYLAGVAFSKSYVGYIHAVAHSLGGQYNIPHGLANAVIMPYVLEDYGKSVYKKLHSLGIAAGVCSTQDNYEEGVKKFIKAIRELNARMNIPEKLQGIIKEDIPQMAEHADKEANPLYPVPKLMDKKELEKFYYDIADWS